jgi:uracil-DNA glycosylase
MTVQPQLSTVPHGILFVGDQPEDEDIVKEVPFAGSHGHLLSQSQRAAGLTDPSDPPPSFLPGQRWETKRLLWERRAHSWTNVIMDRQVPAKDTWKSVRTTDLLELKGIIERCQPNLIVPMGGTALWALTGDANIDAYRGAISVSTKLVPGIKILPTFHPRHILQQYKYLVVMISDFLKARSEAQFPEIRIPPREIWLEPTIEDLVQFKRLHLTGQHPGPLSVDIETGGGQISCVSLSPSSYHSIIVPFVDYRKSDRSYWVDEKSEIAAWAFLIEIFIDPTIEKLFQNGSAFDLFWFLDKMGVSVVNYRHDLRLIHHTLFPELPKSLKFMGATHVNVNAWKAGVHHQHQQEDKRDA